MGRVVKSKTLDFDGGMFYSVDELSKNIKVRPDGSLVCLNVPIARTGRMVYGPGETPIRIGPDGYAHVERNADDLLRPETVASFAGVPVTDDHPAEDVTPENWRKYSVGTVTNPRVGEMEGDGSVKLIVADLIISDKRAIDLVKSGKREVSCGYDADYEQTGEGQGRQSNIIGNHVALVEKGRCGPRCAIRDSAFNQQTKESTYMTQAKSALEKLRGFFRDAGPELEKLADMAENIPGEGEKEVHIHFHGDTPGQEVNPVEKVGIVEDEGPAEDPMESRLAALEAQIASITEKLDALTSAQDEGEEDPGADPADGTAPAETEDEDPEDDNKQPAEDMCGAKDSAALLKSWNTLLSDVEVLVPGYRLPTFDAKAKRKSTVDNMCRLRRNALSAAYITRDGKALIDAVSNGVDFAKCSCADAAIVFGSAVGAKRVQNNRATVGDSKPVNQMSGGGKMTIADMQARHNAFWAGRR